MTIIVIPIGVVSIASVMADIVIATDVNIVTATDLNRRN